MGAKGTTKTHGGSQVLLWEITRMAKGTFLHLVRRSKDPGPSENRELRTELGATTFDPVLVMADTKIRVSAIQRRM